MEGGRTCEPYVRKIEWSWPAVTAGFWCRYPNPQSKHVLSEDVFSRTVDPATGCLKTVRLITKTNSRPKWMDRFLGENQTCLVLEESTVDPNSKRMSVTTRNITMKQYMEVIQHTEMQACDATGGTDIHINSTLKSDLSHLGSIVERFGVERLKHNTKKSVKGLLYALESGQVGSPTSSRKLFNPPRFAQKAYCDNKDQQQQQQQKP